MPFLIYYKPLLKKTSLYPVGACEVNHIPLRWALRPCRSTSHWLQEPRTACPRPAGCGTWTWEYLPAPSACPHRSPRSGHFPPGPDGSAAASHMDSPAKHTHTHRLNCRRCNFFYCLLVHGRIDKTLTEVLQLQKIKYNTFYIAFEGVTTGDKVFFRLWVSRFLTMTSFWLVERKHPKYTFMCCYVFFFPHTLSQKQTPNFHLLFLFWCFLQRALFIYHS